MRESSRTQKLADTYRAEAAAGTLAGSAIAVLQSLSKEPSQSKKELLENIRAKNRHVPKMLALSLAGLVTREHSQEGYIYKISPEGAEALTRALRRGSGA